MCMVSMVHDYSKQRIPMDAWLQSPSALSDLKKIITLLEKLDKKLGQPDCVDPEKEKHINDIEEAIKKYKEANA